MLHQRKPPVCGKYPRNNCLGTPEALNGQTSEVKGKWACDTDVFTLFFVVNILHHKVSLNIYIPPTVTIDSNLKRKLQL